MIFSLICFLHNEYTKNKICFLYKNKFNERNNKTNQFTTLSSVP